MKRLNWRKRTGTGWTRYQATRGAYTYLLTEDWEGAGIWELWTAHISRITASDPLMIADFKVEGRAPRVTGTVREAQQAANDYIEALDKRR